MKDLILKPKNRFTWMLLAFQAGFVNFGGLLCVHLFVSHITGYSSYFAKALYERQFEKGLYFLLVPLLFLTGAMISSLFTEIKRLNHQAPIYIFVMAMIASIYCLVAILGGQNQLGVFNQPLEDFSDFVLIALLSFNLGAQNALFTRYSQSIIRTTHLTGLTTDLGIGITKYFIAKEKSEGPFNKVRMQIIFSFLFGAIVGAWVFPELKFAAFYLPAVLSLIIALRLYSKP
jgi:uncharacterized membrane protein YoaK (UPF0700 family)